MYKLVSKYFCDVETQSERHGRGCGDDFSMNHMAEYNIRIMITNNNWNSIRMQTTQK